MRMERGGAVGEVQIITTANGYSWRITLCCSPKSPQSIQATVVSSWNYASPMSAIAAARRWVERLGIITTNTKQAARGGACGQ